MKAWSPWRCDFIISVFARHTNSTVKPDHWHFFSSLYQRKYTVVILYSALREGNGGRSGLLIKRHVRWRHLPPLEGSYFLLTWCVLTQNVVPSINSRLCARDGVPLKLRPRFSSWKKGRGQPDILGVGYDLMLLYRQDYFHVKSRIMQFVYIF